MTGREVPRTAATTVAYAEIVQPPDSAVRLALSVDNDLRLRPGDVLHVELSREQAGQMIVTAGTVLGYRVTAVARTAGGA